MKMFVIARLLPLLLFCVTTLCAQTPAPRAVKIKFVPPPMEGAFSLGIYDAAGKLVRVLHREADVDEFEIGRDALITTWDGNNDAGEPLPAGRYSARGYAIGDVQVEGIGFSGNDFVTDEHSPRVAKISSVWFAEGKLWLRADEQTFACSTDGEISPAPNAPQQANATSWSIDEREVKQVSASGELLRRLRIPPEEPQPVAVAADESAERIYLLERDENVQRLRALKLVGKAEESSDWEVEWEKTILTKPELRGSERATVKLQPNALKQNAREKLELTAGFDVNGSFLKTADGLPLHTISETKNIQQVLLSSGGENIVDVWQYDGAVVEQFRVTNADQLMSFDCGQFDLK
jgi:hypothetical protein